VSAPELLSPAGTLRSLRYALAYGADAVYAGLPRYSLRVRNNEFSRLEVLGAGIALAHHQDRRFYLACNLMPHGAKLVTFLADMEPVVALAPDALIMADPGLIMLARERWPDLPLHLSVQANTVNAAAVRFWQQAGVSRVILSRELSLDEVDAIRQACPDVELEVFVHGALCIAYSGRCLLSGYFNHRDANQGTCTNSCRWEYRVSEPLVSGSDGRHPAAEQDYLLEEAERPGQHLPVFEDEHGTYVMNSKDLRAIEHVERLVGIGVDCLKIEGRTKSHYYAARTTQAYRRAIDDACAGRPFHPALLDELEGIANRGYTDGFYRRHRPQRLQNYLNGSSLNRRQLFVAEVLADGAPAGMVRIEVKNKLALGDPLELITPRGNHRFRLEDMRDLDGNPVRQAPGGGYRVLIGVPAAADDTALIARYL
jgi:putative protease